MKYEEILMLSQAELLKVLPSQLLKNGYKQENIIITENYIYAIGSTPVMLVAHLDTVHSKLPTNDTLYYDEYKQVYFCPENGLGADDRSGIFAILELSQYNKPSILFTTDEEIGGLGAYAASRELFPNVNYIIELDRKGKNDMVFYECENKEFITYVKKFGFKFNTGSYSDICELMPKWDIAGVNLSIGYYNQHSKSEYQKMDELYNTIDKVHQMLQDFPENKFKFNAKNKPKNKTKQKKTCLWPIYLTNDHITDSHITEEYMTKNHITDHSYTQCQDCYFDVNIEDMHNKYYCKDCVKSWDLQDNKTI